MMERIAKIETSLEHLAQEVHGLRWWIFGVGIGSVIAVVGTIICFAQWQGSWFQDAINARQDTVNNQIEEMDKRWQAINAEQQKRFEIMMQAQGYRIEKLERQQD